MKSYKLLYINGLTAGMVFILSYIISHVFFYSEGRLDGGSEVFGYATMIIALSTVYFGVRSVRDKKLGGVISFVTAFKNGLVIVLIASIIYVVCWMIYYPNFLPDFAEQYTSSQLENYRAAGMSVEEINQKEVELRNWISYYENPFIRAGMTFLEIFPVGLIVAVIAALVLKKKESN